MRDPATSFVTSWPSGIGQLTIDQTSARSRRLPPGWYEGRRQAGGRSPARTNGSGGQGEAISRKLSALQRIGGERSPSGLSRANQLICSAAPWEQVQPSSEPAFPLVSGDATRSALTPSPMIYFLAVPDPRSRSSWHRRRSEPPYGIEP